MRNIRFEHVQKRYDQQEVISDLNLEVQEGERLILLGPSGCGKSTILRMIAGLENISGGDLYFGEERMNLVPPGERRVSMVFQNYALFPHMTVEDNITYALRVHKLPAQEIRERLRNSVDLLELNGLESRKPKELSGGQRQRVALARALVKQADVFLLDEPLSNLDALLRVHARKNLLEIHKKFRQTMIYVTHDQIEAMTLGDRVALLYQGNLQMIGTPTELYHRPVNLFTASFIGTPPMNLFPATVQDGNVRIGDRVLPLPPMWREHLATREFDELVLGIRPERLAIRDEESPYAPEVPVDYVENYGNQWGIHFRMDGETGVALADRKHRSAIRVVFDPNYFHFFDRKTERNLGYPPAIEALRDKEFA